MHLWHVQVTANANVQKDGKGRKRAIMMTLVDKEAAEVPYHLPPSSMHGKLERSGQHQMPWSHSADRTLQGVHSRCSSTLRWEMMSMSGHL